ncbi:MAG: HD domain-containing protein [candidate division Zixibacteria bacterium]|nr:HD domain-containing protein [candidate division Zixibacteria bacterium]
MQFLEKPAQSLCPIRNEMSEISHDLIKAVQKNGRIYEVGGVVRDRLLLHQKPTKDCDYLVTGISYDDLTKILRTFGRVDLVGQSFGVIKFTQSIADVQHTFDITLPRKEHSTGVGHKDFAVSFDPSLPVEEDLKRRDFTINAIARVIDSGELVDPLGGVKDLENRTLKMVSEKSFEEDPLRMLRAVQLSARFKLTIEDNTLESLKEHHGLISSISAERIAEELNKLLIQAEKPSDGFRLMHTTGLLNDILPQLQECVDVDQPGGYHRWDVFEHTIRTIDECPQNLRLRLAALFHDIRKPQHKETKDDGCTFYGHEIGGAKTARRWLLDYRYPNDLINEVVTLVERHMFTSDVMEKGLRRLIRKVGLELIFDLLDLRRADVVAQGMGGTTDDVDELEARIRHEIDKKSPFGLKDLPIKGSDLMKLLKLESGPAIGEILNHLLEQVLDFPEKNITSELESMAKDYYQENLNKLLELNRKRLKDTNNENS